ncbi:MAG: thioredoxin family protein [Candidatus Margulisiibacteriota bacterium]|jgi:thiol:disulfide interchange protein DsbD
MIFIKNKLALILLVISIFLITQTTIFAAVKINLISDVKTIKPGYPFWLGIQIDVPRGEHLYWINPGKSGLASEIIWQAPKSILIEETLWPYPKLFYVSNIFNYGYSNLIILLAKVNPSEFLFLNEKITIPVTLKYLECKKFCEPKIVTASITLPVANEIINNQSNQSLFGSAYQKLPKKNNNWEIFAIRKKKYHLKFQIKLDHSQKRKMSDMHFFLLDNNLVKPKAHYLLRSKRNAFIFDLPLKRDYFSKNERLKGILTYDFYSNGIKKEEAVIIDIKISQNTLMVKESISLFKLAGLIFFALVGGLILNLMPCVFPVISLKVLQLAEFKSVDNKLPGFDFRTFLKTISFVFGILFTLWLLVGLLFLSRSLGEQLGWGFQLQEPWFVAGLIYLFFFISLYLFGLFEYNLGFLKFSKVFSFKSIIGAFLNGVLLVLVATPCTGPFLGVAIGLALMQHTFVSWIIFTALGVGISLPYIVFAVSPVLIRLLPRPGSWLIWFRELLAFPIILTVLWLSYVLYKETNIKIVFVLYLLLIGNLFLVWVISKNQSKWLKLIGFMLVLLSLFYFINYIKDSTKNNIQISNLYEVKQEFYSKARLKDLIKAQRPVLVKVTADWCLLCKMNDKMIFQTQHFAKVANKKQLILLVADWTKNNPDITDFLNEFNRNSVPFYVYFPINKAPVILPELLNFKILEQL